MKQCTWIRSDITHGRPQGTEHRGIPVYQSCPSQRTNKLPVVHSRILTLAGYRQSLRQYTSAGCPSMHCSVRTKHLTVWSLHLTNSFPTAVVDVSKGGWGWAPMQTNAGKGGWMAADLFQLHAASCMDSQTCPARSLCLRKFLRLKIPSTVPRQTFPFKFRKKYSQLHYSIRQISYGEATAIRESAKPAERWPHTKCVLKTTKLPNMTLQK